MTLESRGGGSFGLSRRHLLMAAGAGIAAGLPAFPVLRAGAANQVSGEFEGLVDIGGGRKMFLRASGEGEPAVVCVSGYLNTGGAWTILPDAVDPPSVFDGVAEFTRIVAYDRPGTLLDADPPDDRSRSDPIPQPTTAEAAVADLHALLQAAGIATPFVLAGHSFGGFLSRLYASTYPDEVAGIVSIDAFSEGVRAGFESEHWETWLATNGVLPDDFLAANPDVERIDLNGAMDAMETALVDQPLREMPLAVLTAGQTGHMTPEQIAELPDGYFEALEAALAWNSEYLGGLLPDAWRIFVPDSGHYIQAEKPALVIDVIREVVEAVRDPSSW